MVRAPDSSHFGPYIGCASGAPETAKNADALIRTHAGVSRTWLLHTLNMKTHKASLSGLGV